MRTFRRVAATSTVSVLFTSALATSVVFSSCLYEIENECGLRLQCPEFVVAGATNQGGEGGESPSAGGSSSGGNSDIADSGGAGGEAGGGGAPVVIPCNGACGGATPVCDEELGKCVECVSAEDCSDGVCEPTSRTCVECVDSSQCGEDRTYCDAKKNVCVHCLEDKDCSDPSASRCVANECTACATNADCRHLDGKGVCDAKECVQCSVTDESPCDGNSCNPARRECTETPVGTRADCEPCVADSECVGGDSTDPDRRCVPMEFKGVKREGGFCLRRVAKECQRPYLIGLAAESLSGAPSENYCGIDHENVRCEAILDLSPSARACTAGDDATCGCERDANGNCLAPGEGGLCRDFVTVKNRCTYRCGNNDDCPDGKKCGGDPVKYCQ
ncbi:MAG TPA: hypothetical protein VFQ61_15440 [Polyangiaceae bacterium]|nr:hypothetical protein [Polyangiaceae bacterium]